MGKKNLTFKTELNGYKKCEVDERLQKDARRIEVLEAQVALVDGLKDENQRLASEVEKYKKCEDEVKNVLAVATKKAFDIKTDMKLQYALETERLKIFKAKWTSAYDELKRKYGFDTDAAIVESTVTDVSLKIEAILNKDFGIRLTDDATDAEKQLMEEADRLSISQDEINKLVEKLKGELKNVSQPLENAHLLLYNISMEDLYLYTTIAIIPLVVLTLIAGFVVQFRFAKYSKENNLSGLTGAQAARKILDEHGLFDVAIVRIEGNLTDNFNPKTNVVSLSPKVHDGNTIAAVAVAAHEVGHAIQHAEGYAPMKLRGALVPACVVTSKAAVPLLLIGILLEIFLSQNPASSILFFLGIACYALYAVFTLITLPVEFNASRRAGENLVDYGVIDARDEKKVNAMLRAAGMTYVMSFAMALLQMLRIIAIFGGSRSKKK